jgi:hypothetical protein
MLFFACEVRAVDVFKNHKKKEIQVRN